MLPYFGKNKQRMNAGVIVKTRPADEKPEQSQDDSMDHDEAILACAKDLIEGVHSQNAHKVADAFRSAFEILEMMPHDEAEHDEEDNSFAGRNIAAAKESQE